MPSSIRGSDTNRLEGGLPLAVLGTGRRLLRHPSGLVGCALVFLFFAVVALGPALAPYDCTKQSLLDSLTPPCARFLMGTDEYGRDVLSRVIMGARVSLAVGLISVAIAAVIGVPLGLLAGYFPAMDGPIMRFTDVLLAFPGVLLAMGVVAALGPGLYNVMVAMGVWAVPVYTRVMRGSVLAARTEPYVEGARAIGLSDWRIVTRHVLPNCLAPIIVVSTTRVGSAILSAAGLSFLGLGAQPPTPDWGAMLSASKAYARDAYWVALFPGLAVFITVLGFNLLGDALRDVLDPRLRR